MAIWSPTEGVVETYSTTDLKADSRFLGKLLDRQTIQLGDDPLTKTKAALAILDDWVYTGGMTDLRGMRQGNMAGIWSPTEGVVETYSTTDLKADSRFLGKLLDRQTIQLSDDPLTKTKDVKVIYAPKGTVGDVFSFSTTEEAALAIINNKVSAGATTDLRGMRTDNGVALLRYDQKGREILEVLVETYSAKMRSRFLGTLDQRMAAKVINGKIKIAAEEDSAKPGFKITRQFDISTALGLQAFIEAVKKNNFSSGTDTGERVKVLGDIVFMDELATLLEIIKLNGRKTLKIIQGIEPGYMFVGHERAQLYPKPRIINGVRVEGEIVIDFGEKRRDDPTLSIERKYYYDQNYQPLTGEYYLDADGQIRTGALEKLTRANLDRVVGWQVETNDKIKKPDSQELYPWNIINELAYSGEFVIARAIDADGEVRAQIVELVQGKEGYLIDIILSDYETGIGDNLDDRITYFAVLDIASRLYSYKLEDWFTKTSYEYLTTVAKLREAFNFLSISGLNQRLEGIEEYAQDKQLVTAQVESKLGDAWVTYYLADDPYGKWLVKSGNEGRNITFNLRWLSGTDTVIESWVSKKIADGYRDTTRYITRLTEEGRLFKDSQGNIIVDVSLPGGSSTQIAFKAGDPLGGQAFGNLIFGRADYRTINNWDVIDGAPNGLTPQFSLVDNDNRVIFEANYIGSTTHQGKPVYVYKLKYSQIPSEAEFDLSLKYMGFYPGGVRCFNIYNKLRPGDFNTKLYFDSNDQPLYWATLKSIDDQSVLKPASPEVEQAGGKFTLEYLSPGRIRVHEYQYKGNNRYTRNGRWREYRDYQFMFYRHNYFSGKRVRRESNEYQWYTPRDNYLFRLFRDNVRDSVAGTTIRHITGIGNGERHGEFIDNASDSDRAIPQFIDQERGFWYFVRSNISTVVFIIVALQLLGVINIFRWFKSRTLRRTFGRKDDSAAAGTPFSVPSLSEDADIEQEIGNQKQTLLSILNDFSRANDNDAVIAVSRRLPQDLTSTLNELLANPNLLSINTFKQIVSEAKRKVEQDELLSADNLSHYILMQAVAVAYVPHLNRYFEEYHFHTAPIILDNLRVARDELKQAVAEDKLPNLGKIMFRTNAPHPHSYLTNLLKIAQPIDDVDYKEVVFNIVEELVKFMEANHRAMSSVEYDEIVSHHVPRTHETWYDITNALSELIGAQIHRHNRTTTKQEMVIDDTLRRIVELRHSRAVKRLGQASDGLYIKFRKLLAGYVEVPLEEYALMRMVSQNINANRPTFVRRMVEMAQKMKQDEPERIFPTIQAYDRFWSIIFADITHGIFIGGLKAKQPIDPRNPEHVRWRPEFFSDDFDRLHKRLTPLRKDLGFTLEQARECLERVIARQKVMLRERAKAKGKEADYLAIQDAIEESLNKARSILDVAEPQTTEEFYTRLADAMMALLSLDGFLIFAKKIFAFAPMMDTKDRMFMFRPRFIQEIVDAVLLPQKRLESQKLKLPLVSYPFGKLKTYYHYFKLQFDRRLWNIPENISFGALFWGLLTKRNFWDNIGHELGLNVDEIQHMKGGLREYLRLLRNIIYYNSLMHFLITYICLPKLLASLGLLAFPQNLLVIIPAALLATLFGCLFGSSAFYLRIFRVAKEHSEDINSYEVRTIGDVHIALSQLKGSTIGTRGDNLLFYPRFIGLALSLFGIGYGVGKLLAFLGWTSGSTPLILATLLALPILWWMTFRIMQKPRLRKRLSFTNFGGSRERAQRAWKSVVEDLAQKDLCLISQEEKQKLISLSNISHNEIWHLHHIALYRIKQFLNKLYRTDIPECAEGKTTPYEYWDDIPRTLFHATVVGAWDHNWNGVVDNLPDLLNNSATFKEWENYLKDIVGLTTKEIKALTNLLRRFPYLIYQAKGDKAVLNTNIDRELIGIIGQERLQDIKEALALFYTFRDDDIARLEERNRRYVTVMKDYAGDYMPDPICEAILARKQINLPVIGQYLPTSTAIPEITASRRARVIDVCIENANVPNQEQVRVTQDLRRLIQSGQLVIILQSSHGDLVKVSESSISGIFFNSIHFEITNIDGDFTSAHILPEQMASYLLQAKVNYAQLAAEKFAFNVQYVAKWMGDVSPATPALHKYISEYFSDLPNLSIIEPMNYSLVMPIKDSAWMVQVPIMAGARHFVGQDVSNRVAIEELHFLPHLAYLYEKNPRLGQQLFPLYADDSHLTLTSGCGGHAESTWTHPVQEGINAIGSLTMYGKTSLETDVYWGDFLPSIAQETEREVEKWRRIGRDISSGRRGTGPKNRAAEDAVQGEGFLSDGGRIEHTEFVEMVQNKARARKLHKKPEYKYAGDVGELFMDEEALRFLLSPAPVHYKLTTIGLGHFFLRKLPGMIGTVVFVILNVFHINPWYGLILAWLAVTFSYLFMQAITLPAVTYYNQMFGTPFGLFRLIKRILIKPFFIGFFPSLYPNYVVGVTDDLQSGCPRFPPTMRGGYLVRNTYEELYEEKADRFGILLATPLVFAIVFLSGFHPFVFFLVSICYINMVFGWIIYPEVYNPGVQGKFLTPMYEWVRYRPQPWWKIGKFLLKATDVFKFFFYAQGRAWKDTVLGYVDKNRNNKKVPGILSLKRLHWTISLVGTVVTILYSPSWIPIAVAVSIGPVWAIGKKGRSWLMTRRPRQQINKLITDLNEANEYVSYEPELVNDTIVTSADKIAQACGREGSDKWFTLALDTIIAKGGLLQGLINDAEVYKFIPARGVVNEEYTAEPNLLPKWMRSRATLTILGVLTVGLLVAYAWSLPLEILGVSVLAKNVYWALCLSGFLPTALYIGYIAVQFIAHHLLYSGTTIASQQQPTDVGEEQTQVSPETEKTKAQKKPQKDKETEIRQVCQNLNIEFYRSYLSYSSATLEKRAKSLIEKGIVLEDITPTLIRYQGYLENNTHGEELRQKIQKLEIRKQQRGLTAKEEKRLDNYNKLLKDAQATDEPISTWPKKKQAGIVYSGPYYTIQAGLTPEGFSLAVQTESNETVREQVEILKTLLAELKTQLDRAPPELRDAALQTLSRFEIIITSNQHFLKGSYASCNIDKKRWYLDPDFFVLSRVECNDITYHELISHITKRIRDEERALRDTELRLESPEPIYPDTLNIVHIAREGPGVKGGGIGDVLAALPVEQVELGHRVSVIMPHPGDERRLSVETKHYITLLVGTIKSGAVPVEVKKGNFNGVDVYYLFNPERFGPRPYDKMSYIWDHDLFARAAEEVLRALNPDVVNLHDFHPAFVAVLMKKEFEEFYKDTLVVGTIHNFGESYDIQYSGDELYTVFNRETADALRANPVDEESIIHQDRVSMAKALLMYSDILTTVSKTYGIEIADRQVRNGLGALILERIKQGRFLGIINGINLAEWNPAEDAHINDSKERLLKVEDLGITEDQKRTLHPPILGQAIAAKYDKFKEIFSVFKQANKQAIIEECHKTMDYRTGHIADPERPLIAIVSRLTPEKGFELLDVEGLCWIVDTLDVNLMVLATGPKGPKSSHYDWVFEEAARRRPRNICFNNIFDIACSHRILAGCDFVLMPSRYEACGLVQMFCMRYGTIPIVRKTGGLADTVIDGQTGISFEEYSFNGIYQAIQRAKEIYGNKEALLRMVASGMSRDSSWATATREYLSFYQDNLVYLAKKKKPLSSLTYEELFALIPDIEGGNISKIHTQRVFEFGMAVAQELVEEGILRPELLPLACRMFIAHDLGGTEVATFQGEKDLVSKAKSLAGKYGLSTSRPQEE
ncbi:MAG: glycogen synthase, partial [Planctomycetota bacterium]